MLKSKPERAIALVVGVDHYEYGERWRLAGPASDALKCLDWLIARGVKQSNIALFLSAASWKGDPDVAAWVLKNNWKKRHKATRNEIVNFVDKLLPKMKGAEAIFIYWGGHGVVDDRVRRNYLYTEDAASGTPYCVCVQDLMAALQRDRFSHLQEQVAVFDACANPFSDSGETAEPAAQGFALSDKTDYSIKQCQLFAAAAGKTAANVSERRSGLFSEAFFKEIANQDERDKDKAGKDWPDFLEAFEATVSGIEALALNKQQPFLVLDWPGNASRRSGRPPGESAQVTSLLKLVLETDAKPPMLFRLYLRSTVDQARALDKSAGIEQWLRDLYDLRPREANYPSPLIEFAERLARELKDGKGDGLAKWVLDQTRNTIVERAALNAALDAEQVEEGRPRATLFIEMDPDVENELRWWVYAPDPRHCSAPESVRVDGTPGNDLASHLSVITAKAEQTVGHKYVLAVGIIVPDRLLLSEIESTEVRFDDGLEEGDAMPLNARYPVTLHWDRRARAKPDVGGKPINAWRQALSTLGPRIAAGGGAEVVWLEPAAQSAAAKPYTLAAMKLLSAHSTGICVGLGHLAAASQRPPDEVIGCLREGVPCFFWLASAPDAAADVRKVLCDAFAAQKASEAPLGIAKLGRGAQAGSDPLCSIRMVWDEPGYLPSTQAFPPGDTK